jgi:von Willebrand factor type A domain.
MNVIIDNVISSEVKFGNVVSNDYLEKEIIIKNPGSINLIIGKIADNNPLATPFRIWSDGCSGNTMAETQMCIIKVRFSPTTIGSGLNDTFDIPSNASNTVTVSVNGNGIAPPSIPTPPPPPSIFVSSNDIVFGDVDLNNSSDLPISIKNAGSLNLQIGQIAKIDPLATPFSIRSDSCSNQTLAANNICSLFVRFSPTSQGDLTDSFDIPSNDPNKPSQAVIVRGKGKTTTPPPPGINLSSNNLTFGNVVWNNVSEQNILINTTGSVGSNDLIIGQIANRDPLVAPFSISIDNCSGKHLAPTQTCALQVRFSPTSQGVGLSDSFDVPSNDPNKPSVGVNVSGNGRALRVSINEIRTNSCPDNISFLLNILDKDGNPISGLQQDNMAIIENGAPKSITSFSHVPSPLSVSAALAIDFSGSLSSVLPDVISSSKGFIDQLNLGDEAAIITFSGEIQLQQSFTTDKDALKTAIDSGKGTGEGTVLYDALWSAIDNAAMQTNNRAIIIITDGEDSGGIGTQGSVKTLTEVINHAKGSEVTIFTIGIGVVNIDVMTQLANETGGQFFLAQDTSKLGNIYTAIRNILSGDYTVAYQSSARGSILLDLFVDSNGMQGEVSRQIQGCFP